MNADSGKKLREAAAMVMVRNANQHGIEVCMLRRVAKSSFAAGAFVFPGGVVDEEDIALDWSDHFVDSNDQLLTNRQLIPYKIAAIRETFEEAGILVATFREAGEVVFELGELRNILNQGRITFHNFLNKNRLKINLKELIFYDHWVTPKGSPIRFDTRFFLSISQSDQRASPDNQETDLSCWAAPAEYLELYEQNAIKLMPVTHVQLKRLSQFESVVDLRKTIQERKATIKPTLPTLTYDENNNPLLVKISLQEGDVEYPVFLSKSREQ